MDQKTHAKAPANTNAYAIKHWMSPSPYSVGSDQLLRVAHEFMREHEVRHLPVLDGGRLVGIVSQRDLYFVEGIAGVDADVDLVEEGMSRDVYTVEPEEPLANVVREMANHRYGSAIVMTNGKVVGIFTTTDALELLARYAPKAPSRSKSTKRPSSSGVPS
jgi:acetoin utilization protein AcuB